MKRKIRIIISYLLVLVWLVIIFYLSSMDNNESNYKSKKTINTVLTVASQELINNQTEENIVVSNEEKEEVKQSFNIDSFVEKINPYIRKCTHAFVYMVLAILLLNALRSTNVNGKKLFFITIIFCMLYAMTDEYHQTFVYGRTGRILDVFIDTAGATIGYSIYYIMSKIIKKINLKYNSI